MKHKHLHATLFLIILTATSFAQRVVPLWRYKNDRLGKHFYTVIQKEIGPNEQKQGWEFEGPACWVYTSSVRGSVAFNRFVNNSTGDHFYSLHLSPSEAPPGYIYEGPACTINADKVYDRQVPLWEYYKPSSGEHFYTIQRQEIEYLGKNGQLMYRYGFESPHPAGWVYVSEPADDPKPGGGTGGGIIYGNGKVTISNQSSADLSLYVAITPIGNSNIGDYCASARRITNTLRVGESTTYTVPRGYLGVLQAYTSSACDGDYIKYTSPVSSLWSNQILTIQP